MIRDEASHHFPDYAKGMVSSDKEHFHKNLHFGFEDSWLVKVEVPCEPVAAVVEEMGNNIDLVLMDMEGMEYEITSNFPFSECSPMCFIYESKHQSEEEKIAFSKVFLSHGYLLTECKQDTIALKQELQKIKIFSNIF